MKLYIHDANNLYEQDVEIEVKHKGVLEVPEGKNVDDLPMSHFEKLAKKKGLSKITKALNNLQVWNKNDDPELSKWAGDMIDKLNKKLKKDESFVRISEAKPRQTITVDIPKKEYDFHFKGVDQDGWKREVNRVQVIYGHKGQFVELVLIDDNGVRLSSARKKFKIIENDIVLTDYDKNDIVIGKIDKIDTNESFIKESGEIPTGWKERTILDESTRPFETIEDAARYYFNNWYNGFDTSDKIRRHLRRYGYSDDFISAVFEFISELSDEAEEYWDDIDESLNEADYAGYYDPFDYQTWTTVHVDRDKKQAFIDGIHKLGLEWKLGHSDRKSDTVELRIFATQDELAELADIVDAL